ncbi:hypothetical protein PCANC_21305 [Puccinia coronata f. sp. avenae]|uniref:Uncharacterized protein n=1 Tax=Puccinia coronata f. sp. avenae TaxID=200324 RepID=A0A2N5UJT8_9BASI|nr:hypothetical protein PCANC_21305 [Puccinia coronata f. sp. avenae]
MARSHHQDIPRGNWTKRLRRCLNASSNADAYTRLRACRNNTLPLWQQPQEEQGAFHNKDILDHPHEDQPNSNQDNTNIEEQDDECDWIKICDEEDPNPIDAVIEACKARHQELAKEHNYSLMLESLHPVYMRLKFKTKDWAGPNALQDFRHCQCLPHTKIARLVDLINITANPKRLLNSAPALTRLSPSSNLATWQDPH